VGMNAPVGVLPLIIFVLNDEFRTEINLLLVHVVANCVIESNE
jgi:hypothetical protein